MKSSSSEVAEWVDMYAESLLSHACYLVTDRADAEDLVQEVFLTALSQYDSFEYKSSVLTWLRGILHHKVADFYKRKTKVQHISFDDFFDEDGNWKKNQNLKEWETDEGMPLEALLDNREFREVLDRSFENLPEKWALVMRMHYLEEKKSGEICQVLGISTTNYWKMLQRGRLQLREYLDINWFNK